METGKQAILRRLYQEYFELYTPDPYNRSLKAT